MWGEPGLTPMCEMTTPREGTNLLPSVSGHFTQTTYPRSQALLPAAQESLGMSLTPMSEMTTDITYCLAVLREGGAKPAAVAMSSCQCSDH